jgi:hypothetical protein
MDEKTQKRQVTHLLATFSVTFTGPEEKPLVAARITADGRKIPLPFVLLVGAGANPLTVSGGIENPLVRAGVGRNLSDLGAEMLQNIVAELLKPSTEQPALEMPPAVENPQGALLDTEENQ